VLLGASRASGDVPTAVRVPLAGRPAVAGAILALDAALLVAFATVTTDDVLRRAGPVAGLVALVATTVLAWRAGAFTRRPCQRSFRADPGRPAAREGAPRRQDSSGRLRRPPALAARPDDPWHPRCIPRASTLLPRWTLQDAAE
jgi:hypothetical protein